MTRRPRATAAAIAARTALVCRMTMEGASRSEVVAAVADWGLSPRTADRLLARAAEQIESASIAVTTETIKGQEDSEDWL